FKYKAKPTAPATKIMGKASLTPLEMSIKAKKPRPTPAKISINHLRFSAATPRCSGLGPVAGNDFVQVIIAPVELEVNPIRIHIKAYMIQAPLAPRVQQALGRLGEGAPGHGFGHVVMESIVVGQQLGAAPVGHPEGDGPPLGRRLGPAAYLQIRLPQVGHGTQVNNGDRKSTRLNSSHV